MKKKKTEGLSAIIESVRELQKELNDLQKVLERIEKPTASGNGSVKTRGEKQEDSHG